MFIFCAVVPYKHYKHIFHYTILCVQVALHRASTLWTSSDSDGFVVDIDTTNVIHLQNKFACLLMWIAVDTGILEGEFWCHAT